MIYLLYRNKNNFSIYC